MMRCNERRGTKVEGTICQRRARPEDRSPARPSLSRSLCQLRSTKLSLTLSARRSFVDALRSVAPSQAALQLRRSGSALLKQQFTGRCRKIRSRWGRRALADHTTDAASNTRVPASGRNDESARHSSVVRPQWCKQASTAPRLRCRHSSSKGLRALHDVRAAVAQKKCLRERETTSLFSARREKEVNSGTRSRHLTLSTTLRPEASGVRTIASIDRVLSS
ncbi:hypothetical protein V8E36_005572 [Tilletia maclaganii]